MKRIRYYLWRGLLVIVVIGAVAAAGAWWWITSTPEYRLRRALEAVENDDLPSAERTALRFEADGHTDYAHFLRGKMLFHENRFAAALAELNQIRDQGALRVETAALSGRCLLVLGDSVQAERAFRFVVNQKPDHVEGHQGLASVYKYHGAYMRAVRHAEEWAKLAPRDGRPHRTMGLIYYDLEMSEQAIPCYEEALRRELHPLVAEEVRLELAECQIKRGEYAAALQTLEHSNPPASALAKKLTFRAEGERGLARSAEATATVERALAAQPRYVPALRLRASMHLDAGQLDKAAGLLERAVLIDPQDFAARDRLAHAYAGLGKKDLAEAQRQKIRETQKLLDDLNKVKHALMENPRDAGLHTRLAEVLDKLERRDEAAQARRTAQQLGAAAGKPDDKR